MELEVVVAPVNDIDQAKHFYSEQVGFVVDHDMRHRRRRTRGAIDAAHAQLAGRGVAVGPVSHFEGANLVEGRGGRWNPFIFFSDPDGNSWAVQECPQDS